MGCNRMAASSMASIGFLCAATYSAGIANILDLSPTYAGTLVGIINGSGAISGILTTYLITQLTIKVNTCKYTVRSKIRSVEKEEIKAVLT